jgi:hypothetical protein
MSMNFTGSNEPDLTTAESDSLFAATPIWERSAKKKSGFGSAKAKTAAPAAAVEAPMATRPAFVETTPTADQIAARELRAERLRSDAMLSTATAGGMDVPLIAEAPVYATRAKPARSASMAPLAVGAGILVLGGLAAAGWYATRDDGVTALTPGSTSTAALETAPIAPAAAPTELAANTPAPAPAQTTATVRTERVAPSVTTTRTTSVRTRSAPATSAADVGVDTSATLPSAPQPYAADGATAPTTVNPAPVAPAAIAPAPVVAEPAPAATPTPSTFELQTTPPVASDPTP